jgi:hypothetical protein
MSHPLLGNTNEVSGGFTAEIKVAAKGGEGFEIGFDESTFKIDNEYYSELYKDGALCPAIKITCKNTLLSVSIDGFNSEFISQDKLDKLIEVEYYLAAAKSFKFNPKKGSVNDFFMGETDIEKGYIMSRKQTKRVHLEQFFGAAEEKLIRLQHDNSLDNEFEVDWGSTDVDGKILVNIKDKRLVEGLKETMKKHESKYVAKNSFLGPILIYAIGSLGDDNGGVFWAEELKRRVGYVEDEKERYKDLGFCMNRYNKMIRSEKGIISDALNQLKSLLNNDE